MALSQKFQDAVLRTAVLISILDIDKRYHVLHNKRHEKYGTSVLLTTRESIDNFIKVFLPRIYRMVLSEDDITAIIDMTVLYHVTYKGKCFSQTRSFYTEIHKCIT